MSTIRDRKQRIVEEIKHQQKVQISDLSAIMDEFGVSEKTIARDLAKLIEDKLVEKEWTRKFTYYALSPHYTMFEDIDLDAYFDIPHYQRKILPGFNFDVFRHLQTVDIFSDQEQQKLAELQYTFVSNISIYDSQTLINKEYERIMIEFSWKSASIEWNTYSLLATEALLTANIPDTTKTPEETQMLLNHKDAFNETLLNLDRFHTLSIASIEYIHHILTKKLWIAANIRKGSVGITGTKYKPLDNQFQIEEALQDMVKLINDKQDFFEKAFVALLLTSYIQAFEDGNKRTARMLTNAILLANHSIPLSYRWVDIIEYKKATILFYEQNNLTYFKQLFISQVEDAVKNYFT